MSRFPDVLRISAFPLGHQNDNWTSTYRPSRRPPQAIAAPLQLIRTGEKSIEQVRKGPEGISRKARTQTTKDSIARAAAQASS
jgi:hypothetical protein